MPELPEVETVCRGLAPALAGRKIDAIQTNRKALRLPFPPGLKALAGVRVKAIRRRAKYVLMRLEGGRVLVVHLGMSGRLLLHPRTDKYTPGTHDHFMITMENGLRVVLNDPRRFGLVALVDEKTLEQHKLFAHLGPEPLEKDFSPAYLAGKLQGKKVAVKLAIMDQRLVVGVGNIYASEALFMAGIDPRRAAATITPAECKKLVAAIKTVLKKAIRAGGSSLRDYVQTDGELGYFQHHFTVYGRDGQGCKGCTCAVRKTGGVVKLTQGGRSTFYCPRKQA